MAQTETTTQLAVNEVGWPFALICCLPVLGLRLLILLTHPRMYDFIAYWASGHLYVTGGHPYSETAILAVEHLQGWEYPQPLVLLCPPWTLPFVGVTALLSFRTAQICWFAISLVLNCLSALGLWIYFGGAKRKSWIAVLVCATFIPMGGAELLGQITPLILACLTAFLLLQKQKQHFAAGVFLLGFGFKPHLLYLLFLAILLWIVRERAWATIAGAITSYGTVTTAALIYNPNSLDYFRHTYGAAIETSCGLGGVLRSIFGLNHVWLQFLPCVLGLVWFSYTWARNKKEWVWQVQLPMLVLVSVSTSPYCWYHDFILVIPALISLAVRGCYRSFYTPIAYLIVQVLIFESSGLPEAWRSAVSTLWVLFYWIAASGLKQLEKDDRERKAGLARNLETYGAIE